MQGENRLHSMHVHFSVSATASIGVGHVLRCWALAEEFGARGAEISFGGRMEVPWVAERIRGLSWALDPHSWNPNSHSGQVRPDLIVVDSYEDTSEYRQILLDCAVAVVAIVDDFHTSPGPGSMWVNPGAPSRLEFSRSRHVLDGPDYVLIRQEVRDLRTARTAHLRAGGSFSGLTFLLGGTDFAGMGQTINQLRPAPALPESIWAGPGQLRDQRWVRWLPAGTDLLERMTMSELVVSPAGVSSWEIAHIGVPCALILATENQSGNYTWMTRSGWANGLGRAEDIVAQGPAALSLALADVLARLQEAPEPGPSRIDGLGAQRVVEAAISLL